VETVYENKSIVLRIHVSLGLDGQLQSLHARVTDCLNI
jgi:hypothetical protein